MVANINIMRDKGLNMNLVAVEGGNKTQREICEKVVHYMIGKLMPRMRTLDIEVQLKNLTGDAVGFCMMEENNRQFTIEADRKLGIKDLVTTICHEMIHVKQYARKRWTIGMVLVLLVGKVKLSMQKILTTTTFLGRRKPIVFKTNMQTWYGMRRLYNDAERNKSDCCSHSHSV